MPTDWTLQTLPEYDNRTIHVATFQCIQDFKWWFDGKQKRELILGFSYKNGHSYLIAGKYELHGHLFFKKIKTRNFSPTFTLRPILFLRFPAVSEETLQRIERDIEARVGTREISCIELLRLVLDNGGGIAMKHFDPSMIYLQQFVESFLKHGFVDNNNGRAIPFEVYLNERWNFDQVYEFLGRLEKRFYWLGHSGLLTARLMRLPGNLWRALFSHNKNLLATSGSRPASLR
jgi:hypothetical protein